MYSMKEILNYWVNKQKIIYVENKNIRKNIIAENFTQNILKLQLYITNADSTKKCL